MRIDIEAERVLSRIPGCVVRSSNSILRAIGLGLLCVGSALFFAPPPSAAVGYTPVVKLLAADGAASDELGRSVAVSGDTAVLGAPGDAAGAGSAYVFRYDGASWIEVTTLTALDGAAGDGFGSSVGIAGDTIVVGAVADDDNGAQSGSAYVFRRSGVSWAQEGKLTASDGAAGDGFGSSVSVSGNSIVVGASRADIGVELDAGAAYPFRRSGTSWSEEPKLIELDGRADALFGSSVAISGETIMVGSPYQYGQGRAHAFRYNGTSWPHEYMFSNAGGQFGSSVAISNDVVVIGAMNQDGEGKGLEAGTAFVYRRKTLGWTIEARLSASDGHQLAHFGAAIAVSGDVMVVGAPGAWAACYVFVYVGGRWGEMEVAELTPSDDASFDPFGQSVAVSGNLALVGAPYRDDNGIDSGSAYLYDLFPPPEARLVASDGAQRDLFGASVALLGDTALIGAPRDDDGAVDSGSVYLFGYDAGRWSEEGKLSAADAALQDFFGAFIALSGNRAVVAAPGASSGVGAAYVLARSGGVWSEEDKLNASDGDVNDGFAAGDGGAVALSGDRAVVGAPYSGGSGGTEGPGAAYVFGYDGLNWVEQAKLIASDGRDAEFFGESVALSGDTLMVGAPDGGSTPGSLGPGAVYVFEYSGVSWVETDILTASAGSVDDDFGKSIALSSNTLVISAPFDGEGASAAYIFRYDGVGWVEQTKLTASDGVLAYQFGNTVAVSGDTVLVGARGASYVYQYDDLLQDWIEKPKFVFPESTGSASISGDTVIVGAPVYDTNGVAYVYSTLYVPEPSLRVLNLAALVGLAWVARGRACREVLQRWT